MVTYADLFSRNNGIFTNREQDAIRSAHILVIGCGGIGATTALCLARCGVEHFTLVEFDNYEPSNMNRQMACFTTTLGRNKAEVVAEQIKGINPQAEIDVLPRLLTLEEIKPFIHSADLVFPAADDFAYSQLCFQMAQQAGKPSLYVLPAGLWAYVSLVLPSSPRVEELTGMPIFDTYDEIKRFYQSSLYRSNSGWYVHHAGWLPEYQQAFARGEKPPAQICPLVWTASSLGAMQGVKYLAGRKPRVTAPRLWWLSDESIRVVNVYHINRPAFWRISRKIYWWWLRVTGKTENLS